jgi:hypothetical protein
MNENAFYPKRLAVSCNNREGHTSHAALRSNIAPLARGMVVGSLGGLVGTLVMDVILMGALLAAGLPASLASQSLETQSRVSFRYWI